MEAKPNTGKSPAPNLEPDMAQARQTAVMAHNVVIKLKEMGLPDKFDENLAKLSTDLGDLWNAQRQLTSRMENFLNSGRDWETTAETLVDLKATLDHIRWHLRSVKHPMKRITEFAYGQVGEDKSPDNSAREKLASE